ncbi:hypothetical protein MMC12_005006 [Toensbergia leucococca]|nr:hypothetical protein [Toensbergia leucococca]
MDSFTRSYMAAIMPEKDCLTSIGSVAANFSRTSENESRDEFVRWSNSSSLDEQILQNHGVVAYEEYLAEVQALHDEEEHYETRRLARKQARAAAVKKFRQQIRTIASRLVDKIARLHI